MIVIQNVTGQKDPIMKLLRELGSESGREKNALFFVEEAELVRRTFKYGGRTHSVILAEKFAASPDSSDIIQMASASSIDVFRASEGLLAKMLEAKPTPECICIAERKVAQLSDIFSGDLPLVMMVESCENADNLGMLLRSTDAAGITGVVLTADTVDPFARRVVRGSRGAIFTTPICIHRDSAQVIEEARKSGLQVIATSARSEVFYTMVDYAKPTMIVVGNEHVGISDTVREMVDRVVRIPMMGKINSLNIAVAASVVMYDAVKQRLVRRVK